ncbi:hypothetical protein C8A05DRAFT_46629 [Staphylotrichum tortipilum]|uniref:Fungal calcium binding protein domain-containing protein n=1 Tax=Staphylotrichum tortipilum TaxID=2831512 RepID=A0AAN6RQI3_9PEZI|nr:hypothetical protein C8A05DRAFT_46629 [Staphylotrichum longicolle]
MKFTATSLTTLALLAPALALPSGMTPRATFNEAEVFSFPTPAGCSLLSCINVIAEAVCIADAIDQDNWTGILTCAKKKELCGCADCFSALGGFLDKYGIC